MSKDTKFVSQISISTCALIVLASGVAYAEEDGITGEVSLSGAVTTGNTETTDIGFASHFEKKKSYWRHKLGLTYDFGKADGNDTKNRVSGNYQIARDINERLYATGDVSYYTDDFGPYESEGYIGAGLGYQIAKSDKVSWKVEGGVGYRTQELNTITSADTKTEQASARLSSELTYQVNDAVSLSNKSAALISDSDTYIWNDAGLTAKLTGNLAARFSVRVDHHADVADDRENTDTITRGALVYSIN